MHERGVVNLTVARRIPVVAVTQLVDAFVRSVRFYNHKEHRFEPDTKLLISFCHFDFVFNFSQNNNYKRNNFKRFM